MAEPSHAHNKDDDLDDSLYNEDADGAVQGAVSEKWGTSKLKIVADLVSQVSVGHDLSRVTLPTFLLEPWSLLEKFTSPMNHINLFLDAVHGTDAEDRIVKFARWYVSGWHKKPKGVKKPYNPLLGEYFRCKWEHPAEEGREASVTTYLAEQVSHHPPITAFYISNTVENFVMYGQIYPHSKFLGNSAASLMEGECTIHLLDKDEKYVFTFPSYYARGIIVGSLVMETCGDVKITCEKTSMVAKMDFRAKPMLWGEYNTITGTISHGDEDLYSLSGAWDKVVYIAPHGTKETKPFFDVTEAVTIPRIVPKLAEQGIYESRRTWRHLTRALKNHDLPAATAAKTELEEKQRRERSARNEVKGVWRTAMFHLVDPDGDVKGLWQYNQVRDTPFTPDEAAASMDTDGYHHYSIDDKGSVFELSPEDIAALKA